MKFIRLTLASNGQRVAVNMDLVTEVDSSPDKSGSRIFFECSEDAYVGTKETPDEILALCDSDDVVMQLRQALADERNKACRREVEIQQLKSELALHGGWRKHE
jgi:hypothetical protein